MNQYPYIIFTTNPALALTPCTKLSLDQSLRGKLHDIHLAIEGSGTNLVSPRNSKGQQHMEEWSIPLAFKSPWPKQLLNRQPSQRKKVPSQRPSSPTSADPTGLHQDQP